MNRRVRPRRPINDDTGLKMLMRYARRGKLPPERMQIIKRAMESAVRRLPRLRDELVRLGWKP